MVWAVCVITFGYEADTSDSFSPGSAVDVCYGTTSSPIREPVWLVIGPTTDAKSGASHPSVPTTILASQEYAAEFSKRTQISERTIFWQADLGGMPLSDAAVGITHYAIVDTGTSLLTGHTTDVKSLAASLRGATTTLSTQDRNVNRYHVFCRWCRVRGGCQFGWHLLLRVDRDRRSSTPWPSVELGSGSVSR